MKGNILFIDTVHPALQYQLEKHNWGCVDGSEWNLEKTISEIKNFKGIVIRSRFKLDADFLKQATGLKFIARAGAGMENIDVAAATSLGITCLNAPEGNRNAVAEHGLGMLLALLNNLITADKEVREGNWFREANRGVELEGKTIGIVGFGNTGSAFAKKLSGFESTLLTYDPFTKADLKKYPFVKQTEMAELFSSCDVISFHVPLTEETSFMVNDEYISQFAKPIYLLNTSRGQVVNTSSIVKGLKHGKILGCALDVLEFESLSFEALSRELLPDAFRELLNFKNVILSPHIAGWTFESHRKISEVLAEKILSL